MLKKLFGWFTGNKDVEAQAVRKFPKAKPQIINDAPIYFYLNDPSTPNLIIEKPIPDQTPLKVRVNGYAGGGYKIGTSQAQAAQCLVCLTNSINYILGKAPKPIKKWAGTPVLNVNPRAGKDFNAFYDRQGLRFFYNSRENYKMVYAVESNDIVAHELGHALLDAMRPDFWNIQSYEVWAFHEAFGDCNAILHIMQYDKMLDHALEETGGDLSKSNIISKLAEEMGIAITRINSLRDAVNDYKYVEPEKLPKDNDNENILTRECHSFSRIWTGAWYDLLVGIYNKNIKTGIDRKTALIAARDTACYYLLYAVTNVPLTLRLFNALAKQIISADEIRGSHYQDVILKVFEDRNILKPEIKMLRMWDWNWKFANNSNEITKINSKKAVRVTALTKTVVLKDYFKKDISALNINPLLDLEIEVPVEKGFIIDKNDKVIDVVESSIDEVMEAAYICLEDLNQNGMVGDDINTPFSVIDGKLIRTRACACSFNNADDPQAPEYGKKWKPANNAGCGCNVVPETTPTTPVKIGCVVRTTSKSVVSYNSRSSVISNKGC